jgi:hypothetical protein
VELWIAACEVGLAEILVVKLVEVLQALIEVEGGILCYHEMR